LTPVGVVCGDPDVHVRDVQLVVVEDGTNASALRSTHRVLDLVLVVHRPTVADQDGARELLLEHEPHLGLEPDDHVEVGDVQDVIPVQLLLLVDRGRRGGPGRHAEELFLLHVALDVALGPSLFHRDVRVARADPSERDLRVPSRTPATHSIRRLRNSGVWSMLRACGNRTSMLSMPC
jgi:hypothetical protein